jgi:DNA-binding NtrC family response regulator
VEGLAASKDPTVDVAVLDIRMPHLSGMDLLRAIKQARPDVEVVMMTAFATVETAVEAVKAGAYDYLTKPFSNIDEVSLTVAKALERKQLKDRTRVLEEQLSVKGQFEDLIGQSSHMRAVFKLVETVSYSSATVLIQGESGTGKELVARAIHYRSPRKDKPFIAVNCSALTETLLESELFGHVKGSFTGATANKKGLFEAADGGTIFLDEIGDVPPATQVRLLRVLQEGEVKRVGANETIKVDVRVIAASNVDLARAKDQGKFREDLFYRLNVITVALPPLRDRPEDVPLLAGHFLRLYAGKMGKKVTGISPQAMEALVCHRWMGNVRELENVIERAVVLTSREVVEVEDLPQQLRESPGGGGDVEVPEPRAPPVRRGQAAGDARLRAPVPLGAAGEERAQRLQRRARRRRRPQQLPASAQAVRGRPWAAAAAAAEAQGRADERLDTLRRSAVRAQRPGRRP